MDQKPPKGVIMLDRKKLLWGLAIAGVVIAAVAVFFVVHARSTANASDEGETKHIIQLVGTHFKLPEDEQPTVAKIKDKSKLSDQQFFARAQDGDYLLLYNQYKIAFIYRESINRLINVGPISLDAAEDFRGTN